MLYDSKSMIYRYGQKMHRGFLYRLGIGQRIGLGLFLCSMIMITGMIMGIEPHDISRALDNGARTLTGKKTTTTAAGARHSVANGKSHPGGSAHSAPKTQLAAPATTVAAVQSVGCGGFPAAHAGLGASSVPELQKLAQYEQLCGGAVASKASFFVPTPATTSQAQMSATEIAAKLKAFAAAGVAPLVFIEPDDLNGNNLDLQAYAGGAYDSALNAYFGALQAAGVTSSMMGTWVFMPEGNLPVWTTVDPSIYTAVVTKTASTMKHYFPSAQASLMLDSESYAIGAGWGQGKYVSLLPYVQGIPKGLIDSFGLQGFPWTAPANQPPSTSYDPKVYLRADLAVEAARSLGVSSIWFNTGTFAKMYANQSGATVSLASLDRQTMLNGVIQLASGVKAQGFTVAIHMFAQNKANLSEGTDWSYWRGSPTEVGSDAAVFSSFAHDASAAGLGIWLYDTTGN